MRYSHISLVTVMFGCGIQPTPFMEDTQEVDASVPDDGRVHVERVRLADLHDGRTAVLVTVADPGPRTLPWHFGGEPIALNDRGIDGDVEAGDRVFTGIADRDIGPVLEARERYSAAAAQRGHLRATSFHGYHVTGTVDLPPDFLDRADTEAVDFPQLGKKSNAVVTYPMAATAGGGASPPALLDPYRTQVIIDPAVVYDPTLTGRWQMSDDGECVQVGNPDGRFGFRYLMGEVANGTMSPDELISKWIAVQVNSRVLNGYTIDPSHQGVYDQFNGSNYYFPSVQWPKLYDDGDPSVFDDILDARFAPVQLIAIVNRFDLEAGDGAELRFVFTFIDEEICEPSNGNIILEYDVPLDSCDEVQDWAQRWAQLDAFLPSDPSFKDLLADITTPIVSAGAAPGAPNDSRLKVLRTNEQVFLWPHYFTVFPTWQQRDWRMEEWVIDPGTHLLTDGLLAQTPGPDWVDPDIALPMPHPEDVDLYIDTFTADILAGVHVVPDLFTGIPFRAPQVRYGNFSSAAPGPYTLPVWYAPGSRWRAMTFGSANVGSVEARQLFSLATCSGCHAGEAFEDGDGPDPFNDSNWEVSIPGGVLEEPFRHIRPDPVLGTPAHLSRFLTGTNTGCTPGNEFVAPLGTLGSCTSPTCCPIGDPVFGYDEGQVHYNEFERRGGILQDVLLNGCDVITIASTSPVVASAH